MTEQDPDRDAAEADVTAALASLPPPDVSPAFLAAVNARIDADSGSGWLTVTDFRSWTLRLLPAAGAVALIALLWPAPGSDAPVETTAAVAQTFTPSSATDWQRDIAANALLEAALTRNSHAR
jgi:hypothetical protein